MSSPSIRPFRPAESVRRRARRLTAFCGCFLLLFVLVAPRGAALAAAQDAPVAAEQRASEFDSPRAVMESFVKGFAYLDTRDEKDLLEAARTLYVEGPKEQRERVAKRLVQERFLRIFDRVARIEPEQFDDAATVADKDVSITQLVRTEPPLLTIEIGFERLSGGGWLISRETVERADELWDKVKHLDPLAEFANTHALSPAEFLRSKAPKSLQGGGIWLEPYQWIGLAVLIGLAVVVERLLTLLLRPLIRKLSSSEGLPLDIELLRDFERPIGAIFVGLVFLSGLPLLDLTLPVHNALDIAASFILAVASVWAAYRLVDVVCWNLEQRAARTENKFDDMLVPLLRRTLKVLVLAVGVVFVASRLTDQLWHVLAGLSIGSLAVGFAAKDSIENLFGTFTVLLDNPFKLGDVIKVSDFEGTVEQVGFRSTRVRTPEDSLITVPNSRFIGQHVENFGARRTRRIKLVLSLTYDTPPEKIQAFCEGVRELVRLHPYVSKDAYHVWLTAYAASSLDVELVCQITTTDVPTYLRERHRLYLDILRLASQLRVSFAFPTQTVWRAQPEDSPHADAPRDGAEAVARGREQARSIAATSLAHLGGAPPPPVRFDPSDPDAIGR
jgi:MscS family membrane protein